MTYVADTVPYPWPFDGRLSAATTALVVLGDQPSITARSHDVEATRDVLTDLADALRRAGGLVVHVRHTARRPPFVGGAGDGWALTHEPPPGDVSIDAVGWDALYGTRLELVLHERRISTVALGGFGSEITVDSTVRTLNDRGWECLVVTDACAPFDRALGRRAHASLTMSGGIFGALGTSAALIAALTTRTTEGTP